VRPGSRRYGGAKPRKAPPVEAGALPSHTAMSWARSTRGGGCVSRIHHRWPHHVVCTCTTCSFCHGRTSPREGSEGCSHPQKDSKWCCSAPERGPRPLVRPSNRRGCDLPILLSSSSHLPLPLPPPHHTRRSVSPAPGPTHPARERVRWLVGRTAGHATCASSRRVGRLHSFQAYAPSVAHGLGL